MASAAAAAVAASADATSAAFLLYLTLKEVFWYELPRTLRGLSGGVRPVYLPSGVMNQVSDTKNRVVRVSDHHTSHPHGYVRARLFILIKKNTTIKVCDLSL